MNKEFASDLPLIGGQEIDTLVSKQNIQVKKHMQNLCNSLPLHKLVCVCVYTHILIKSNIYWKEFN